MSRSARHRVGTRFLLRIPILPYAAFDPCGGDAALQQAKLSALADLPEISEGIYLASPALHGNIAVWRGTPDSARGQEIEWSLVKYMARMAAKPTPFGLFAGVATGEIRESHGQDRLIIAPARAHGRRTRVDNQVLSDLAAHLATLPEVRRGLSFRPNTSSSRIGDKLRYIETTRGSGERQRLEVHLVSVEATPYLISTLERAQNGARLEVLARALVADDPDVTLEEAAAYVGELADTQILVPDLGVTVTGVEPIDAMVAQLAAAGLDSIAGKLSGVREQLEAIDGQGVGRAPATYAPVLEGLEALLALPRSTGGDQGEERVQKLGRARVFQLDLATATVEPVTLGSEIAREVQRAIDLLRLITPPCEDPALAEFRRAFRERWGDREVPLAEALDEETGIGFGAERSPSSGGSLPGGSPFPSGEERTPSSWHEREVWLRALLQRAAGAEGAREVVLGDDEVQALAQTIDEGGAARLPDALSATIRLGRRDGEHQIWLQRIVGPSGARLLGRFCHLDPVIEAMVRDHLAREAALRPDAIFAEIVHLADGPAASIPCRPVLRDHEIVYIGLGGAAPDCQIRLDDLTVSVRDRAVLRSRRLGREIVPRLTSAHKEGATMLGVVRFLLALQTQDTDPVDWSWSLLADEPWLPRVRVGPVVLAREQWNLGERDLVDLVAAWWEKGEEQRRARVFAAVQALRARHGLPRYVFLADGDNEEFVDLDHQLLVHAFVGEVVIGRGRRLVEVFPEPDAAVVQGPAGRHACDVILTFVREPA